MVRRRDIGRDPIEIEIEPVRAPRTRSTAAHVGVGEVGHDADVADLDDDSDDADVVVDEGVQWQVALVVVLATLALVGVSVVGVTRRAVDPLAAATTTTTVDGGAASTVATVTESTEPEIPPLTAVEGAPWPSDVAIIVASEHGIDRVTGEKGEAVVTRLDIPPPAATVVVDPSTGATVPADTVVLDGGAPSVERAFEMQDGSLVFQYTGGDIVRLATDGSLTTLVGATPGLLLEDADMPGADPSRLTYLYRTASDDAGATFALAVQSGAQRVEVPIQGGWGVSYGRFTVFAPNSAATTWVDDTGIRGTAFVSFPNGQQARSSVDPSGVALLHLAGDPNEGGSVILTTDMMFGNLDASPRAVAQTSTVSGADARGSSVVLQRDDDTAEYYDMAPYRHFEVPVGGFATVSRFVHSPRIDNVSSALTQDNPRTCIVGFPGNDHRIALYSHDLDADQIAAAEPTVVDGFAALVSTQADGSFVIRVTFDACVLHLRVVDATVDELVQILANADVGHVGVWDACDPSAYCVAPTGTLWSPTTDPSAPNGTGATTTSP